MAPPLWSHVNASPKEADIMKRSNRFLALVGAVLSLAAALPVVASAKHGQDDGAGHVRHHHAGDGLRHR
jgi:hypothetical protein